MSACREIPTFEQCLKNGCACTDHYAAPLEKAGMTNYEARMHLLAKREAESAAKRAATLADRRNWDWLDELAGHRIARADIRENGT